jgi:hypothetical protein
MAEPALDDAPTPVGGDRPRVIYVMGAGRSGSTIFGIAMGNCAGVFYAGELDAWLVRAGEPQLDDEERVRFWRAVRDEVEVAETLVGREAQRSLERSVAPFRIYKWRARRRLRLPYRRAAEDLYRAIGRATGAALIVDTSHYPLRARELQRVPDIDLFLVYLVRDPQSVVASFNRQDVAQYAKSTLTTNVYLWLTHLLSVFVFLKQPRERRLFLRYEDFVADPGGMLRSVLDHVGESASLPDFSRLQTGIPFQGNRVMRSDTVALGAERAPAVRRSRITALLQLPWTLVLARLRPRAVMPTSIVHAVRQ